EGYSGADIAIVVRTALYEPVKVAQRANYFFLDEQGMYTPSEKDPPCSNCPMRLSSNKTKEKHPQCKSCGAILTTLYDIEGNKLKVSDITAKNLADALTRTPPSVAPSELKRFIEWTKEFGIEG